MISALKTGATQRDDFVPLPKTLQPRRIFPGSEKGDFCAGEILPDPVNGGQGEQHIADGFNRISRMLGSPSMSHFMVVVLTGVD